MGKERKRCFSCLSLWQLNTHEQEPCFCNSAQLQQCMLAGRRSLSPPQPEQHTFQQHNNSGLIEVQGTIFALHSSPLYTALSLTAPPLPSSPLSLSPSFLPPSSPGPSACLLSACPSNRDVNKFKQLQTFVWRSAPESPLSPLLLLRPSNRNRIERVSAFQ